MTHFVHFFKHISCFLVYLFIAHLSLWWVIMLLCACLLAKYLQNHRADFNETLGFKPKTD